MGLLDRFRGRTPSQALLPQAAVLSSPWPGDPFLWDGEHLKILDMDPATMWRTQPYLRTVVTFLARNVAQLGLHAYQRVGEHDRRRLRDGIAEVVGRPNDTTTTFEIIYGLVADLALWDRSYWLLGPDPSQYLTRLPVPWVTPAGDDLQAPTAFQVRGKNGQITTIPAERVLYFHGWTPESLLTGSSPVAALKEILSEQVQAARYREMVWRRGGKVGAVLIRPPEAPEWGEDARRQFRADWDSKFTGSGPEVGGTPMLEDGMRLERVDFNAKEMEFIEGARLALNTVASVFHVNPTMIGLLDNANYSNVREFRRMLYGDTLGPILAQIEDRLNAFLVPLYDSRPNVYLEFNIEAKLQGNFEEQTMALQAAVGAPWMTRNEARAVRNMRGVEGGDELVTPLNVLIGDQASPVDSAPPPEPGQDVDQTASRRRALQTKARIVSRQKEQIEAVLRRFFIRQRDAQRAAKPWDGDRWDRELAKDLLAVAVEVTTVLGAREAHDLGFTAAYDPDNTIKFLGAVAAQRASNINRTTRDQIAVQDASENPDLGHVFEVAMTSRAPGAALTLGTFLAGFATHEAAAQIAYSHNVTATKTWVAGPNSRPEHAALDGVTIPLGQAFATGSKWPGDSAGDDVAGCNCTLQVAIGRVGPR